ncbi:MAG: response regulator [Pseudomonadota bacterium]
MLLHIVDDNRNERVLMKQLLHGKSDLDIRTSERPESIASADYLPEIDYILVDINRPDALSIPSDVERIRKHSSAPIAFVTGGDIGDYRARAIEAGAEGLFEKHALSPELLSQTCLNTTSKRKAVFEPEKVPEKTTGFDLLGTELSDAIWLLRAGLQAKIDVSEARLQSSPIKSVRLSYDLCNGVVQSLNDAEFAEEAIPTTRQLAALDDEIETAAKLKGMTLGYGSDWRAPSEIGDSNIERFGVLHLLLGLIHEADYGADIILRPEGTMSDMVAGVEIAPGVLAHIRRQTHFWDITGLDFHVAVHFRLARLCFERSGTLVSCAPGRKRSSVRITRLNH